MRNECLRVDRCAALRAERGKCAVQGKKVQGRVLVIADGATSKLATAMGYCTEAPKGVCSRAYVKGGTHNTKFDGALCLHDARSLPGLCCVSQASRQVLQCWSHVMRLSVPSLQHAPACSGSP